MFCKHLYLQLFWNKLKKKTCEASEAVLLCTYLKSLVYAEIVYIGPKEISLSQLPWALSAMPFFAGENKCGQMWHNQG